MADPPEVAPVEDENAAPTGVPEPETDDGPMLRCDWCHELWPAPLMNWNVEMTEKICMACAYEAGELDY